MAKKKNLGATAEAPKEEAKPVEPVVNPEAAVEPAEPPKAGKNEVVVQYLELGQVKHRTYSKEMHGKDFEDLADEFVKANPKLQPKIL